MSIMGPLLLMLVALARYQLGCTLQIDNKGPQIFRADDSPLSVLRQTIFHDYDKFVIPQQVGSSRPVFMLNSSQHGSDSDPLVVHLGVAPKWMDLDSNGVLTATVWLRLVWTDFRLAWNPEDHDGIEVFR